MQFHPTLYWACDCLSMVGLKVILASKRGPRTIVFTSLQWRHNGRDGASNHQPHDYLLNCLFRRRSTKISKLRVIGLCVGNSPLTGESPAQRATNAETVSIRWSLHVNPNRKPNVYTTAQPGDISWGINPHPSGVLEVLYLKWQRQSVHRDPINNEFWRLCLSSRR